MYILASNFFERDYKYVFKKNQMIIYFYTSEILTSV